MKRFLNNQRVTVISGEMKGKSGRVVRLRMADNGAIVNMDDMPPESCRMFHDETDPRKNYVILYPEDCTEETKP